MLDELKRERSNLEVRYAAQRSLLDRLIHRLEQQSAPAPAETASAAIPKTDTPARAAASKGECRARVGRPPTAARKAPTIRSGAEGSVRAQMRDYINDQPGEITCDMMKKQFEGVKKGTWTAYLSKLERDGLLKKVGRGRYAKTKNWRAHPEQSDKEAAYAAFRSELNIKPLPSPITSVERNNGE